MLVFRDALSDGRTVQYLLEHQREHVACVLVAVLDKEHRAKGAFSNLADYLRSCGLRAQGSGV